MLEYKTNILEETSKYPTRLDSEKIVNQRAFYPSNNAFHSLKNKEAGELGEWLVFKYLEKYGKDDWVVIKNIWINYGGQFEGDLVLLTNHGPYLFEVKNYQTDYTYENGVSKWNDNSHSGNPINQTIRNKINLENMFRNVKVQGVLMLVGVDSHVEIDPEISEIETVQRTSLRYYIQKIVEKENNYNGSPMNKNKLSRQLERYEIHRLQGPKALTDQQIDKLRKGIYCLHCKSFDVAIGRKEMTCSCGFSEKREMSILRTICEYGVLTFDRNLQIGKLLKFFGGQIARNNLRKVLRKYFKEIYNGRYSYFLNLKLPFYKLYEILNIESTIQLKIGHQDYVKIRQKIHYYDSQWEI